MHGCYRSVLHADWLHANVVQARLGATVAQRLCVLRRVFVCAVAFCRFGGLCEGARQVRFQRCGPEARRVGSEILTSDRRLEE